MTESGRILVDQAMSGPANMARDEALLVSCGAQTPPTLRFYRWSPATISLGYFQDYSEYKRLEPPARDIPVVRRTTGGGAILHDLEVTYSLVIPKGHALAERGPTALYAAAHRAIVQAVGCGVGMISCRQLPCGESRTGGPFFCFARRHALDVLLSDPSGIGGYSKIAGSAQRRTSQAVLQHGSIMLDSRFVQQPVATWAGLAGPISFDGAVSRLTPAFEAQLGLRLTASDWTAAELDAARRIEPKYAGVAWTQYRQR